MPQQTKEETATTCENHPGTKAVWCCKECKKSMCKECKAAHDMFFKSNNHTVVPVVPPGLFDEKCPEHPECCLGFVCNDCNGIPFNLFLVYLLCF